MSRKKIAIIFASLAILFGMKAYSASAATYYVANNGNDSNSGTTESTPWKTIAKVNNSSFQPGDNIFFKRGDTWREQLTVPSSGTDGHPITFGAYGEGEKPRVYGSVSKNGINNWTNESGNLWYCNGVSWINNSFGLPQGALFHDGLGGKQEWSKSDLDSDWEWWYDAANNRAYIFLGSNPGIREIEVQQRNGTSWGYSSYTIIRDIEIAYSGFGIALYGGKNWTIDNVYIHDVAADAVHGNGGSNFNTVQNSTFTDWDWKGYKYGPFDYGDWSSNEPYMGYGIHVQNSYGWKIINNQLNIEEMTTQSDYTAIGMDTGHASLIEGNTIDFGDAGGLSGGIMFWRPNVGGGPATIRENTIKNAGSMSLIVEDLQSFTQPILVENNIFTNSDSGNGSDSSGFRIWTQNSAPVTARYNIVNGTVDGSSNHPGLLVRNSSNVNLYNNVVIGADDGFRIESGSNVVVKNNISSGNRGAAVYAGTSINESNNNWNGTINGFTKNANDISADPRFVSSSLGNFNLQSDSPCIDAGANVGLTSDFEGTPVPQGSAPDIGAIEYKAETPTYSQSDLNADTKIDLTDLNILKTDFLKLAASLANPKSDINADGQATIRDIGIMMSQWRP